ncbi:MAG: hypothetical protein ACRDBA_18100 [Clostridium sp.]
MELLLSINLFDKYACKKKFTFQYGATAIDFTYGGKTITTRFTFQYGATAI